jgi:hypothetical protein
LGAENLFGESPDSFCILHVAAFPGLIVMKGGSEYVSADHYFRSQYAFLKQSTCSSNIDILGIKTKPQQVDMAILLGSKKDKRG